MILRLPSALAAVLAALAAATAPAQTAPDSTPAATASFRSALDGYQPYVQQDVAPWRASNDTVGRIGGWRVYAREASEGTQNAPPAAAAPAPAQAGPGAPASPPASNPPPAAPRPGHGHH